MTLSEEHARDALRAVQDPALQLDDLVKHRFVSRVEVESGKVLVELELPTVLYPENATQELKRRVEAALLEAGASKVVISVGRATAWKPPPSDKALLPGVKNVIAVAAGKGGVGKSTVATNLALALSAQGASVGLLDADVFGPSIPTMLGDPQVPASTKGEKTIVPAQHHGLKVISVGFFTSKDEAVVWRGPMVHRLLQQFLGDVAWDELDYLVCDLPPGTGDVQLSLSQLIPISGAVMVTTPQEVSIVDVVKGISMFDKVEIPILGVIENMSYYECPKCGNHDEIFSRGGGKRLAKEIGATFLGEVPIDSRIRFGGDSGVPIVVSAPDSVHAQSFRRIATEVALEIARRVVTAPKRSSRLAVIR